MDRLIYVQDFLQFMSIKQYDMKFKNVSKRGNVFST